MTEEAVKQQPNETNAATEDMELEGGDSVTNGESNPKRVREDEEENVGAKKPKVDENDKSVEEERLEKKLDQPSRPVSLGPKQFGSSVEMFDYLYKFLHYWPPNVNVNKYEQMVLLKLLEEGHAEPDKKIGGGIQAFQVRYHPMWKSRCFFLIRDDDSVDDFSFRKCVDHILPLPEDMKIKSDANKALSGGSGKNRGGKGGGHGHGRGGHGRGRGGKSRN
ncbi:hypothetical protein EZV62_017070 [Acer yangbiense]|uniref:Uncharacterized protein n=1 Tax=Acer yangbiense TaxID=1000413 RepID=A0A5C7HFL2_9ROSI|nr:hypothetical protein EZV62_017070 [Acer yangbiense]